MLPAHTQRVLSNQDGVVPSPTVSFVVPCYKLAHVLTECVDSILRQTYGDFEILIMDDCSPDNTSDVVRCMTDPRITYVRNEQNLGHLANYNKGIALSRGKYIWLISADDRLRRPYVLERYVRLMEERPNVGYICCPGIGLQNGQETTLVDSGYFGERDNVFEGRRFASLSLRKGYGLLSPAVMVRKDCYRTISDFPLDMPHLGDWYLWLRWALDYDVAYLSDPMVNYRLHDHNMMKDLLQRVPEAVFRDEVNLLWRTRQHCAHKGFNGLARQCEDALTAKYARAAACTIYNDVYWDWSEVPASWSLTIAQCYEALRTGASSADEYARLRGKLSVYLANQHWHHGNFEQARQEYAIALREDWNMPHVWLRVLFLQAGLGRAVLFLKEMRQQLRHA